MSRSGSRGKGRNRHHDWSACDYIGVLGEMGSHSSGVVGLSRVVYLQLLAFCLRQRSHGRVQIKIGLS